MDHRRDAERVDAVNRIGSSRRPGLNHDDVFPQFTALWDTQEYLGRWFNSPLPIETVNSYSRRSGPHRSSTGPDISFTIGFSIKPA
jgi:hypothetical protein